MADLLREVDEAVRAENFKRLWDEHKIAIITAVSAIILGTAAYSGWTAWTLKQNQKHTDQILTALESKTPAAALTAAAKDQSGNSQAISYINAATTQLKAGDKAKALENYTAAQNSKSADALFRDLAAMQKVNLTLDLKPETKAEVFLKDLEPIASNKKSPWRGEALFMTAFIKAEKNKDYKGAIEGLKTITANEDVTQSLKQRAQALQSVYELKQEKKS